MWQVKSFEDLSNTDLYTILKARQDVFVIEQACFYDDMDGKDQRSFHIFYKEGDTLMAYARILPPGVSYVEWSIGRVLVTKDGRCKGLARDMMKRSMNFIAMQNKGKAIRISAQAYLLDFYISLGFKQVGEPYLEDGIPHLEMLYKD